jgi:NAD+ diphosphatase
MADGAAAPGQAEPAVTPAAPAADPGEGTWVLSDLSLARSAVDRASHHRTDQAWLDAAWADEGTRVLVLDHGQALIRFAGDEAALELVPPGQAPDGARFLLGVDHTGVAYFGVDGPRGGLGAGPLPGPGSAPAVPPQPGVHVAGLRQAGPLLGDRDAGLLTHAVALAYWHATHTHCPRCGAVTELVQAGHAARCPVDGSEHFPRVDPAVIMLVRDDGDRCLLARNRSWPPRRVSILAGFVEPGESLEQAVIREVGEETGLRVGGLRYVGSQPWPMPRSLMLGFVARAPGGQEIVVDEEEIAEARWFTREQLTTAISMGEVLLPPPVSIAHRIIEAWYGAPLPGSW